MNHFEKNKIMPLSIGSKVNSGAFEYEITAIEGYGSRSITYSVTYNDHSEHKHHHILKECVPLKLYDKLVREADGTICVTDTAAQETFNDEIKAFRDSYGLQSQIEPTLAHSGSFAYDSFSANGTYYAVTRRVDGETLDKWLAKEENRAAETEIYDLESLFRIFSHFASALEVIHNEGYLYLDVNAKNIYVPTVQNKKFQTSHLIDLDSVIPVKDVTNSSQVISSTELFAAPEIHSLDRNLIDKSTDYFGLAALLFYTLFSRPIDYEELTSSLNLSEPEYLDELRICNNRFLKNQYPLIGEKLAKFFAQTLTTIPSTRKVENVSKFFSQLADSVAQEHYMITQRIPEFDPNDVYGKGYDSVFSIDKAFESKNILFITGGKGTGKKSLAHYYYSHKHGFLNSVREIDGSVGLSAAISNLLFKTDATIETEEIDKALSAIKNLEMCNHRSLVIISDFDDSLDCENFDSDKYSAQMKERVKSNLKILENLSTLKNAFFIITRNEKLTLQEEKEIESLALQIKTQPLDSESALLFFEAEILAHKDLSEEFFEFFSQKENYIKLKKLLQNSLKGNFSLIKAAAHKIKLWSKEKRHSLDESIRILSSAKEWVEESDIPDNFQQDILSLCILDACKNDLTVDFLKNYGFLTENSDFYNFMQNSPWIFVNQNGIITIQKRFSDYALQSIVPTSENPLFILYNVYLNKNIAVNENDYSVIVSSLILLFDLFEKNKQLNFFTFKKFSNRLNKNITKMGTAIPLSSNILIKFFALKSAVKSRVGKRFIAVASLILMVTVISIYMEYGRININFDDNTEIKTHYNYENDTIVLSNVSFYRDGKNITSSFSNDDIVKFIKAENISYSPENILISYSIDMESCIIEIPECDFYKNANEYKLWLGYNSLQFEDVKPIELFAYDNDTEIHVKLDGWNSYQRKGRDETELQFEIVLYSDSPFELSENLFDYLYVDDTPIKDFAPFTSIELCKDELTDTYKKFHIASYTSAPCGNYKLTVKEGIAKNIRTQRITEGNIHCSFEITNNIVDMSTPTYTVYNLNNYTDGKICNGDSIAYRIEYSANNYWLTDAQWPYQYKLEDLKEQIETVGFTCSEIEIVDLPSYCEISYFDDDTQFAQLLIFHNITNQPNISDKSFSLPQGIAISSNGRETAYRRFDFDLVYTFSKEKTDFNAPTLELAYTYASAVQLKISDNMFIGNEETLNINKNLISVSGMTFEKIEIDVKSFSYKERHPRERYIYIDFKNAEIQAEKVIISLKKGFFQDTQGNLSEPITIYPNMMSFKPSEEDITTDNNLLHLHVESENNFKLENEVIAFTLQYPDDVTDIVLSKYNFVLEGFSADITISSTSKNIYKIEFHNVIVDSDANDYIVKIGGGTGINTNGDMTQGVTIELDL